VPHLRLVPGALLGSCELAYDDELVQGWERLFGANAGPRGAAQAAGAATILMMRAYLSVVTPRPPGNIHARQGIEFAALPQPGDRLTVSVECRGKEIRRGRRYVELAVQSVDQRGGPVFRGLLTLIWAA